MLEYWGLTVNEIHYYLEFCYAIQKIYSFIYLFNVDTFSSNTFLIKIDSKLQNFIILQIVK